MSSYRAGICRRSDTPVGFIRYSDADRIRYSVLRLVRIRGVMGRRKSANTRVGLGDIINDETDSHTDDQCNEDQSDDPPQLRQSLTAGAGLEYAVSQYWSAKVEYLYADLGSDILVLDDVKFSAHLIRGGVNWRF
jgi:opacity protein-like surface antigen